MDENLDWSGSMSFENELASYRDYLMFIAAKIVGFHSAEDMVQDVMVSAIEYKHTFKSGTNMKAWLKRIMVNKCINAKRRIDVHESVIDIRKPEWLTANPFSRPADEALHGARDSLKLRKAIDSLPERYGKVVYDVDLLGLKYEEAANSHGIPVGTVMSRLHRGRGLLASRLKAA